jgi:hypothetical protein
MSEITIYDKIYLIMGIEFFYILLLYSSFFIAELLIGNFYNKKIEEIEEVDNFEDENKEEKPNMKRFGLRQRKIERKLKKAERKTKKIS